jgi:hypothetical protein
VESRLRERQPFVNTEPYENGSAGFHDKHIAHRTLSASIAVAGPWRVAEPLSREDLIINSVTCRLSRKFAMVVHTLTATHKCISTDTRASGSLPFPAARLATGIRPFEQF